jgi:Tfp pilus assembly protein PilO
MKNIYLHRIIICLLLITCITLTCLCLYLWHEVDRLDHQAQRWASRAGYAEGRIEVLEQAKAELIEMVRLAYLKGIQDGAR